MLLERLHQRRLPPEKELSRRARALAKIELRRAVAVDVGEGDPGAQLRMFGGEQGLARKIIEGPFDVPDAVELPAGDEECPWRRLAHPLGSVCRRPARFADGVATVRGQVPEGLAASAGPAHGQFMDGLVVAQPKVKERFGAGHESTGRAEVTGQNLRGILGADGDQ